MNGPPFDITKKKIVPTIIIIIIIIIVYQICQVFSKYGDGKTYQIFWQNVVPPMVPPRPKRTHAIAPNLHIITDPVDLKGAARFARPTRKDPTRRNLETNLRQAGSVSIFDMLDSVCPSE